MMYHNSSAPLLAADVDGDQEEEEERESYEVGVITNHPRESNMNWHEEMDDSNEVKQYCNNIWGYYRYTVHGTYACLECIS